MSQVTANGVRYEVLVMVDSRRRGRRVRIVDELQVAQAAAERASGSAWPGVDVATGGTVSNSYGFRAYTDAVLAIADSAARIVYVWCTVIPANNATLRGAAVAASVIDRVEDLYDNRTGALREYEARVAIRTWVRNPTGGAEGRFPVDPRRDRFISPEQVQVWTDGWLEAGGGLEG